MTELDQQFIGKAQAVLQGTVPDAQVTFRNRPEDMGDGTMLDVPVYEIRTSKFSHTCISAKHCADTILLIKKLAKT